MRDTKLKGKGECELVYEWKDVRCAQRESEGRIGLNGEYGNATVCAGMEGSDIPIFIQNNDPENHPASYKVKSWLWVTVR